MVASSVVLIGCVRFQYRVLVPGGEVMHNCLLQEAFGLEKVREIFVLGGNDDLPPLRHLGHYFCHGFFRWQVEVLGGAVHVEEIKAMLRRLREREKQREGSCCQLAVGEYE